MECNKDEASRAKSIADRKLEQKDYAGAKKFALKAQSLYPGLEGVSQMLIAVDVYLSAENKISGEVDWYGVLNVNPSADDDTIKKQYRKLALLLHPDKNSSIGADGAFKLISEAWSLLSDKAKRSAYNQRRGNRVFQQNVQRHRGPSAPPMPSQQKVPTQTGGSSAPFQPSQQKGPAHTGGPSAQYRSSQQKVPTHNGGPSAPKSQNRSAKVPKKQAPAPVLQRTDSFWTTCGRCNALYEYLNEYRNCTIRCINCQEPFLASETATPVNYSKSVNMWRRLDSVNNLAGQSVYDPGRNVPTGKKTGVGQAPGSFRDGNDQQGPLLEKADGGNTGPFIVDERKRPHTESNASANGYLKKRKLGDDGDNIAQGHIGTDGLSGANYQRKSTRELTPDETRKLLMVNAQKEIGGKLSESMAESNKKKYGDNSNTPGHDGNQESVSSTRTAQQSEKHQSSPSADSTRKQFPKPAIIDVPDSDFHDFDVDRSESSFSDNQIWAAYDDDDGMPRLYALINEVVSRDPFELKISWLSSKTNTEFSNIGWVRSGFYKTCGKFSVDRSKTCNSINAFSQKVSWTKGPNGSITILPQKGDSWALYRNWSSSWSKHTPDEVVHKYDMVMVLNDYSEEAGIYVAPLVKVAGYSTVFFPDLNPARIKRIPREEMLRFSHRIPHHPLSRDDAPGAPQGSIELDPAATPSELLQRTVGV